MAVLLAGQLGARPENLGVRAIAAALFVAIEGWQAHHGQGHLGALIDRALDSVLPGPLQVTATRSGDRPSVQPESTPITAVGALIRLTFGGEAESGPGVTRPRRWHKRRRRSGTTLVRLDAPHPRKVAHTSTLLWVAHARQNKPKKVMPQISADTIAEGDIHWIAAGDEILALTDPERARIYGRSSPA